MVKQHTGREHQSTRLSDPMREVLAAWIIALFSLVAALSALFLHQRGVHDEGIAAVAPRWYSPPVIGAEDWLEIDCGAGIRSCPNELAAADDGTDPKITNLGVTSPLCVPSVIAVGHENLHAAEGGFAAHTL